MVRPPFVRLLFRRRIRDTETVRPTRLCALMLQPQPQKLVGREAAPSRQVRQLGWSIADAVVVSIVVI